jgi:DNA-binding phage protein
VSERCQGLLRALIAEADELGVPVAPIAELTGVTRKSVYKALQRNGRRE